VNIEFLYYEQCPSHPAAKERLESVMQEEEINAEIKMIEIENLEQVKDCIFPGSPTILINGKDIDSPPSNAISALTCRAYRVEDGRISPLPSKNMIRNALVSVEKNKENKNRKIKGV